MKESKFVVQEGHFHIADPNSFVLTGWFDGADGGADVFEAFLDSERLAARVSCFSDDTVRQKYAKYDLTVEKEYVILVSLPPDLSGYRRLSLCFKDGRQVYERRVFSLRRLQGQLNYRVTDVQITGAACVLSGWAASVKPIKINVFDKQNVPMKCEVSHFPKPDVALEYREAERLYDSGFSVTVPMNGRKKLVLEITNGESFVRQSFRAVDKNRLLLYARKAHYYMKRNGMKKACKRVVNELYELVGDTGNYKNWRKKNMPSAKELERQRREQNRFDTRFFIITPYEDSPYFLETAASLKAQTYGGWKWVIACTEQEREKLQPALEIFGEDAGSKVVVVVTHSDADDCEKINRLIHAAAKQTEDEKNTWMALLSAADTLEPNALYACAGLFEKKPDMDLCYTDEDKRSRDGKLFYDPAFKPDFDIDMLRATNYFGHMTLVRADVICAVEGWNAHYGSAAAYDFHLRAVERAKFVGHLQQAVYHVREHAGADDTKTDLFAREALNAHYKRRHIPAIVENSGVPGIYRTVYQWEETPLVSVIIPNKDHIDDLGTCVQSLLSKCTYPNFEILIVENNSTQQSTFDYYEKLEQQDKRVRVVFWEDAYNYSKINNFGAAKANGEYLLLLNNDTEVIAPDFMEEMLGYCMREDVGVCGARLLYFNNTVQHAGVIVGLGGICGEGFQRFPKESGGYLNRILCPQDYSAVTAACLLTKKSVFEEVGGLDEDLQIAYNDIDYCLKVRSTGRLVVYNPFAVLHHFEYKSRGAEDTPAKLARYNREVDLFTTRWADMISAGDPYYNPNLTRRYQDFSLRRIELLK